MPFIGLWTRPRISTAWFVLLIGDLLAVSVRADFHIQPPDNYIDQDVALMLTPWGLTNNFLLDAHPVLTPFYWRISSRSGIWDDPLLGVLVLSAMIFSLMLLWALRRRLRAQ